MQSSKRLVGGWKQNKGHKHPFTHTPTHKYSPEDIKANFPFLINFHISRKSFPVYANFSDTLASYSHVMFPSLLRSKDTQQPTTHEIGRAECVQLWTGKVHISFPCPWRVCSCYYVCSGVRNGIPIENISKQTKRTRKQKRNVKW